MAKDGRGRTDRPRLHPSAGKSKVRVIQASVGTPGVGRVFGQRHADRESGQLDSPAGLKLELRIDPRGGSAPVAGSSTRPDGPIATISCIAALNEQLPRTKGRGKRGPVRSLVSRT